MGEHHCRVCTSVSGGVRLDLMHHGPQVTSFLRVCQHLWLRSSVVTGLKPDVRQRLPFPQWLSLSYWGQGGIPSFWSRSPECQARSGCVPSSMHAPLSQHCNPCHRGTRGASSCYKEIKQEQIYRLAAYRGPGYLQLAICASTSSSVSCPA